MGQERGFIREAVHALKKYCMKLANRESSSTLVLSRKSKPKAGRAGLY